MSARDRVDAIRARAEARRASGGLVTARDREAPDLMAALMLTLPKIKVYRFHETYPGMEDLYHVSCDQHPEFGCCANEKDANLAAAEHRMEEHR